MCNFFRVDLKGQYFCSQVTFSFSLFSNLLLFPTFQIFIFVGVTEEI